MSSVDGRRGGATGETGEIAAMLGDSVGQAGGAPIRPGAGGIEVWWPGAWLGMRGIGGADWVAVPWRMGARWPPGRPPVAN
jgi:hypothetical protein